MYLRNSNSILLLHTPHDNPYKEPIAKGGERLIRMYRLPLKGNYFALITDHIQVCLVFRGLVTLKATHASIILISESLRHHHELLVCCMLCGKNLKQRRCARCATNDLNKSSPLQRFLCSFLPSHLLAMEIQIAWRHSEEQVSYQ